MNRLNATIKKVIITDFLHRHSIEWQLHSNINILGGFNGAGKTTLLNAIYHNVKQVNDNVEITYYSKGNHVRNVCFIDSQTEFNDVLMCFTQREIQTIQEVDFLRLINELFRWTRKSAVLNEQGFTLLDSSGVVIPLDTLSAGEKRLLMILMSAYLQNNESYIFLIDDIGLFLHVEWERKVISAIMKINPNAQLICTTHSPAIIMEGWLDKVFEITQLIKK